MKNSPEHLCPLCVGSAAMSGCMSFLIISYCVWLLPGIYNWPENVATDQIQHSFAVQSCLCRYHVTRYQLHIGQNAIKNRDDVRHCARS